jgi:hypothetical protein
VRALTPVAANRTYNLVGMQDVSIKEIAETVRSVVGDVGVEHVPGRNGDFAGAPVSGDRAAADLGWHASTPFEEGVRRYVEWHRAAAVVPAPAPAAGWARVLASRALLALAWAALAALVVIGVVTLVPFDSDDSPYAIFGALLVFFVPFVLAGAFSWDETRQRGLRVGLWLVSVASLGVAVLPWPQVMHHLDHGRTALLLFALSSACAGQITGRASLRTLLSASD